MHKNKPRKKLLLSLVGAAFLCTLCLIFFLTWKPAAQREDYREIAALEYDTVFLSMYPIDTYDVEDFAYYRAMTVFKASYSIPNLSVLKSYMDRIRQSGNLVTTAYLGICPEKTDVQKLQELVDSYPDITFEIIPAYPSEDYWRQLSQRSYEKTLQAYRTLLTAAPGIVNAHFIFFGAEEWLIANPANYDEPLLATESIARTIMLHSDRDHGYLVTADNAQTYVDTLTALTEGFRNHPIDYPDLSDYCIVFFGDSVIGNYTDSTSIPGVVAGLAGASVFNCGYGGNSASVGPETLIALSGIVDAFFAGDLSVLPEDTQVYRGIASYLENPPQDKQMCYVISYGLNDYFSGHPISSEDPYDITTYSGALRTAVDTIRRNDPDARIILCTPNFSAIFEGGMEPHGPGGNVLSDYADGVIALSRELGTDLSDNYYGLGINLENEKAYLGDQVHPNYACRYIIANRLIDLFR